jgi:hypothetical protein
MQVNKPFRHSWASLAVPRDQRICNQVWTTSTRALIASALLIVALIFTGASCHHNNNECPQPPKTQQCFR